MYSLLVVLPALCNETNQVDRSTYFPHEIVWGIETNAFAGGILIVKDGHPDAEAVVYIRQATTNFLGIINADGDSGVKPEPKHQSPLYLGASNSFCGPVELKDLNGKKSPVVPNVPLLPVRIR